MTRKNGLPDREFLLSWDDIVDRRLTKHDLARHHFPPEKFCFDYAIPQNWLTCTSYESDDLDYATILFTTIWLYPDKSESPAYWLRGIPAVLCEDTARQLERLNIAYWSPRGYHGARLIQDHTTRKENDND